MNAEHRVCALVVTYQPDPNLLSQVVGRIVPQVEQVLLVDNGSLPPPHLSTSGLTWLRLEHNLGLGAAQNLGIRWAQERGFSHVLFCDQDSLVAADLVAVLLNGLEQLQTQGVPVAAVGPAHWDPRTQSERPFVRYSLAKVRRYRCQGVQGPIETDFLVSSGTMAPLEIFQQVGLLDEVFFIDNLDLEWSFRVRSRGYRLFGICAARLEHCIGDQAVRLWLGRWWYLYRHSPLRQYYMARNRVFLYRRPYSPRGWIVRDLGLFFVKIFMFGLIFPPRLTNLRMIWRGTRDALQNRHGPYNSIDSI